MEPSCASGNFPTRICLLEQAVNNIVQAGNGLTPEAQATLTIAGQLDGGGSEEQKAAVRAAIGAAPAMIAQPVTIGPVYPGGGSPTAATYAFYNIPFQQSGRVISTTVQIGTLGDGTLSVCVFRETSPGIVTVVAAYGVTVAATGAATFVAGVDFPLVTLLANEYLGLQVTTAGAGVLYSNSAGSGYRIYAGIAGGTGLVFNLTSPGQIYYQVNIYGESPFPPLEFREGTLQCELETVDNFQILPSGWVNQSSGWSFGGGVATATTAARRLQTGYRYGLTKRKLQWVFRIGSVANIVSFMTYPAEGVLAGSMLKINASTSQISICSAYTGSNTPTPLSGQTFALGFTMAIGKDYLLEWVKDGRTFTVKVQELDGPGYYEVTRTAVPWGYAVYPAFGYDQGAMHGSPGVIWDSGGATGPSIRAFRHWAPGNRFPRLYISGDSITEGFGVTDAQVYATLIADRIGVTDVHVSGIGGATATSAYQRILDELRVMRPAAALLYYGSNGDGSLVASMNAIISFLRTIECRVLVCSVPTSSAATAALNALDADHVFFDKALTVSGAGSGTVPAYYANTDGSGNPYNDALHPNALGNTRMMHRVEADAPWLMP